MRRLWRFSIFALALGSPLAFAERPTWEVQVRMDGGGHRMGKLMAGALFEPMGGKKVLGDETVLVLAGDEKGGWVLSAEGDLAAKELMEEVKRKGGVEGNEEGLKVVALENPAERMEFFAQGEDRLTVVGGGMKASTGMGLLKETGEKPSSGQWIRGGVDFRKLGDEQARSALLKRVKEIRFSLDISEGGSIELEARGVFDQEQTAKRSLRIADGLVALLSENAKGEKPLDERVVLRLEDTCLVVQAEILPSEVARLMGEVKREWNRLSLRAAEDSEPKN